MTMTTADFLFPTALRLTEASIKRVLITGSCAAAGYREFLQKEVPTVTFDFLLTNNINALPDSPPSPIESYDFQFVQISLRDLLTDRVIKFPEYLKAEFRSSIVDFAMNSIELKLDACLRYNTSHGLLTFVSNFLVPQRSASAALDHLGTKLDLSSLIRKLNERLAELIAERRNVYISDIDAIGNSMGKRYFQDDLMNFYSHSSQWYPAERDFDVSTHHNAPADGRLEALPEIDSVYISQTTELFEAVWRQWESLYRTINQIDSVKLVIFDLDDTIWRGQLAEHYGDDGKWPVSHGWPTGLWEAIQHLRARGILTAICSKNEETLVRARWDRAVMDDWLTLDDFLFREINWRPKAENVAKIIELASLTPKSVLFIDDNPVERESVRLALPGIRVLGENPYVVRRVLLWSPETQVARLTDESITRENMMRQQIERETQRDTLSREEFLRQLNCFVRVQMVGSVNSELFPRSFELLNKTNQFNTTGERWSSAQMAAFFAEGGFLFVFHVEDKYTRYGLVGVIPYINGQIRQFAMSCRVLGLDVETSVISAIVKIEAPKQTAITARVVETDANLVCRDIFTRCGFRADTQDSTIFLRLPDAIADVASHLSLTIDCT